MIDTLDTDNVPSSSQTLLKLYDLSTYRAVYNFSNVSLQNSFARGALSADGKYAVCGTRVFSPGSAASDRCAYGLKFWDTAPGSTIECEMSSEHFPFPVRCVSWHPRQHMIAVATVFGLLFSRRKA